MPQKFFAGDWVRSFRYGSGYVEDVTTWRDAVLEMSGPEATEFSNNCLKHYGPRFREEWHMLHIRIGGKLVVDESLYVEKVAK